MRSTRSQKTTDYNAKINGYIKFEEGELDSPYSIIVYNWIYEAAFQKQTAILKKLTDFYKKEDVFHLIPKNVLFDCCTLYLQQESEIAAACSYQLFQMNNHLVCYLAMMRVHPKYRGQKIFSQAIAALKYICTLQDFDLHDSVYILAGMARDTKPHRYFEAKGFTREIPEHLQHLQQENCDMACLKVDRDLTPDEINLLQKDLPFQEKSALQSQMSANNKKRVEKEDRKKEEVEKKMKNNEEEKQIIAASEMLSRSSATSNKSSSRAFNKHCLTGNCGGKAISGRNWSRHINDLHKGVLIDYAPCIDQCIHCLEVQSGYQGRRPSKQCIKCNKQKRYDQFPSKDSSLCTVCAKTKSVMMPQVPDGFGLASLTKRNLANFDDQQPCTYVEDQIQAAYNVGINQLQPHEESHEDGGGVFSASHHLDSQIEEPALKRQNTGYQMEFNQAVGDSASTGKQSAATTTYIIVAATDQQILDELRAISVSDFTDLELAQKIQKICHMFTQDLIYNFLNSSKHDKIIKLISIVAQRVRQLNVNQIIGLAVASFGLEGGAWSATVKMLQGMPSEQQEQTLQTFRWHIQKQIGEELANWFVVHWRHAEQQHLSIAKRLKKQPTTVDAAIMSLSLAVTVPEFIMERFIGFAEALVETNKDFILLECISQRPRQIKLVFNDLVELTDILQQQANDPIIQKMKDHLINSYICDWKNQIEQARSESLLHDGESIQSCIDEYIDAFGDVKGLLRYDLTLSQDFRYSLLVNAAIMKPNSKQFAFSQFSNAKLQCSVFKQLCQVESGQGKSRMAATTAAIALLGEMFTKVHLVFENQHLLQRDKADFLSYWALLSFEDKVEYHVGCDFKPAPSELIIFDEADTFMFNDPVQFCSLIEGNACICYTATPDNCNAKGVEATLISALGFQKFEYNIQGQRKSAEQLLRLDEVVQADSDEDKAAYIISQIQAGPILVFCNSQLKEEIKKQGVDVLEVTEECDFQTLRKLDETPYKLLVAEDKFGMRGIDYRCQKVKMTLVIAQSFDNTREAIQGFERVGRFGDPCKKVIFKGVQVIDQMQEIRYNAKLVQFVSQIKKKISFKPIQIKEAVTKGQPALKMNNARMNKLLQSSMPAAFNSQQK